MLRGGLLDIVSAHGGDLPFDEARFARMEASLLALTPEVCDVVHLVNAVRFYVEAARSVGEMTAEAIPRLRLG